jgi:hypothetical protein
MCGKPRSAGLSYEGKMSKQEPSGEVPANVNVSDGQGTQIGPGNTQYNFWPPKQPLDPATLGALNPRKAVARLQSLSHDELVDFFVKASPADVEGILDAFFDIDPEKLVAVFEDINRPKAMELLEGTRLDRRPFSLLPEASEAIASKPERQANAEPSALRNLDSPSLSAGARPAASVASSRLLKRLAGGVASVYFAWHRPALKRHAGESAQKAPWVAVNATAAQEASMTEARGHGNALLAWAGGGVLVGFAAAGLSFPLYVKDGQWALFFRGAEPAGLVQLVLGLALALISLIVISILYARRVGPHVAAEEPFGRNNRTQG